MIVKAFSKSYKNFRLDVPDIEFEKSRIYALVGGNGSGKSTYAKAVAGITKTDAGKQVFDMSAGYMSQSSFAFRMSVKKNLMLNTDDPALADEMLSRLGLSQYADENAKNLSGGQKARMALARVMVRKYDLLILDEPTAAMDVQSSLAAEKLIKEYAGRGSAVLLITHSLQQARRVADELLYFEAGRLVERGDCLAVLDNPENEKTKAFIEFYGVQK